MSLAKTIKNGIYLVVDPAMEPSVLWRRLSRLADEKFAAIQIWDNFKEGAHKKGFIHQLKELFVNRDFPILTNNDWKLCLENNLDGVHFDSIPSRFTAIISHFPNQKWTFGLTCNNDLSVIQEADNLGFDYISFCSMFSSSSANSCDLVTHESVLFAHQIFKGKIFLSGGIKPSNMSELNYLTPNGIAVISGLLSSDTPELAMKTYLEKLKY